MVTAGNLPMLSHLAYVAVDTYERQWMNYSIHKNSATVPLMADFNPLFNKRLLQNISQHGDKT